MKLSHHNILLQLSSVDMLRSHHNDFYQIIAGRVSSPEIEEESEVLELQYQENTHDVVGDDWEEITF